MTNFLNLPIEVAGWEYGHHPENAVLVPDDRCRLIPCPKGGVFRQGDEYVRFDTGYVHTACLDTLIKELSRESFLIMLARHVAIAPSRHNAGTIRQVIRGLCKALGTVQAELDKVKADAYARGAKDAAEAIAEANE